MILEDILGESEAIAAASPSSSTTRRRALHVPGTSHLDMHHNNRPSVLSANRRRALRAHHLPYNRFKRPRRLGHKHRHLTSDSKGDLLDSISVEGGYDGEAVFFRLGLDVSKQAVASLEEMLKSPLDLLNEVDFLAQLFDGSGSGGSPLNINTDISLSASAHLQARGESNPPPPLAFSSLASSRSLPNSFAHHYHLSIVGYDITAEDIKDILFGDGNITVQSIASNAFLHFEDISAQFLGSARLSADLDVAGVPNIGIENATAAVGLGIGMEESNKIYFNDIDSVFLSLRDSRWRKVAVMDVSLPISLDVAMAGLSLTPIVSIRSDDLFLPDPLSISVDFDVK